MAAAVPESDIRQVIAEVKSLIVNQLKEVLRSEGFGSFSNLRKPELQERVIRHLRALAAEPNPHQYERLRSFIYNFGRRQPPPLHFSQTQTPVNYRQPTSIAPPPLPPPNRPMYPGAMPPHNATLGSRIMFKDSPFYTILEPLTQISECKIRENTRDNVEMRVILNPTVASRLQSDPNTRVYLFGAADNGMTPYSRCDVAFPYQVELKVNLDEVKANLRGLKNKPGTTRPVDITDYLRKKAGYPNQVVLTYALTHKKFYLVVNLVQHSPVGDLITQLKQRKTISSEQVIREMRSKAEDADIVATSSVLSLKCPLSTLRIDVPCRTSLCSHNQCFDARSFLQLQQQAPTWTCPVCNKVSSFEGLQIDQYVDNILKSTSTEVDQVTIEPSGDWFEQKNDEKGLPSRSPPVDDDSDLVEITDGPSIVKKEATPAHLHLSTPTQSREQSSVSSVTRTSNKRPASEVIDLTLSDDDEPPRQRPMYRLPNGHPPFSINYPPSSTLNHSSSNTPDSNVYWIGNR